MKRGRKRPGPSPAGNDRKGRSSSRASAASEVRAPRSFAARETWKFCVVFVVLISILSACASSRLLGARFHSHLTRMLASLSVPVLNVFGEASATGHNLRLNGFYASIDGACDGMQPTCVYVAAILAYRSRWREKGIGLLFGIPAILGINFLRIISVTLCGAYWPSLFEKVHLYGWQAIVILLTITIWTVWAERYVGAIAHETA